MRRLLGGRRLLCRGGRGAVRGDMWMIGLFDVWMNMIPGRAGLLYTRG